MVDRTVARTWGVRIVEEDEWFASLPVLVEIGSQRVTVCVNRLDDLSITRDDPIDILLGPHRPALAPGKTGPWVHNACAENGLHAGLPLEDDEHRTTWPGPSP